MVDRRHLFVCIHLGTSGRPGCGIRGGVELLNAVRNQGDGQQQWRLSSSGCLGGCSDGPNAVSYPDGVWLQQLAIEDAADLAQHLTTGTLPSTLAAKQRDPDAPADPANS
ncbi:MAG: (2Fe-2S) ferredoxin domain-containing protein [Kofleriaceae bacterium]|nr:(2Fe-2S) ferredoxin domain-containing protein [Kofleriaceae bacterium]